MADLEGFFAKKDKKKTKPKKFVPEEMAQKLEEAEKKQQEKERRAELSRSKMREEQLQNDDPSQKKEPVDEWQDEEEETVDLSDLNIKELPQPEAEKPDGEQGAVDADGNPTNQPGPWNKKKTDARDPSPDERPPEPEKKPEPAPAAPEPAKTTGGYVPPHRRNMPAGSESSGGSLAPVRMGGGSRSRYSRAPDISSDEAFPTLGAAVEETARGAWGQRGGRQGGTEFQRVRHGNTQQDQRLQAPKLSIGNQFDALRSNDC